MNEFSIAAAQVASIQGDIAANVATHAAAIEAAARLGVSVLVFPELSLTGYEPELAAELAIEATDTRLAPMPALALQHRMAVVVGAPLGNGTTRPNLGAILYPGDGTTRTYAKMTLGSIEPHHFTPGAERLAFSCHGQTIGLAICADTSQASHPQAHADAGASIYAAGVFLNAEWYPTDMPRLAGYAARFGMLVVMANHGASVGTLTSVGKSAVWAPDGTLLAQAAGAEACLVVATSRHGAWRGDVVAL